MSQGNTHPTTSPELLPCPFCGGEMTVGGRSFGWFGHKGKVAGKISDCPIFREDFPPAMREAWNTRQPQSPSTSLPDAPLRRVLHELRLSERVFHDYGVQHQEKAEGCEPGFEREARWAKAKRNYGRAAACKAALDAFDEAVKSKEQSND